MKGRELPDTHTRMTFRREFGVLLEDGSFANDTENLHKYGLPLERMAARGRYCPAHGNSFVMKKHAYWAINGYRENTVGKTYPQLDEHFFRAAYRKYEHRKGGSTQEYRPKIYHFPNGHYCGDPDFNPFNLFHTLSRKKLKPEPQPAKEE